MLLGDVSFPRRDQKVKETKVSLATPVAPGGRGTPRGGGRGLREAPRGEDLSEAAQFAGASQLSIWPFRCVPAAGEQLFSEQGVIH